MDYSEKTRKELIALCKERGMKGYSTKKKDELVSLLQTAAETPDKSKKANKKDKGQFYTTKSSYILDGFTNPPSDIRCVIEPFAGQGDLLDWLQKTGWKAKVEAYDIEPKKAGIQQRDTLRNPPEYKDTWILTNPPFLARNKSKDKELYDLYNTNDLYKCFLTSVIQQNNCRGGILIIPAGFFFSPREIDVRCRHDFLSKFRITKVKYFEETVFDDTTTTIVAFSFERSETLLKTQDVKWTMMPSKIEKTFTMSSGNDWIIGGDIYNLPVPGTIKVRRHVEGQKLKENEQQTFITLNALDSGTKDGRICLQYKKGYIYPAQECSRTYATFRISGKTLSEQEQQELCSKFNTYLELKREETWSLFLPQFRESKEYARKRIPFELAYRIFLHLIHLQMTS